MNIAICEDDLSAAQHLLSLIRRWADQGGHCVLCDAYDCAEQFLFQWPDQKKYDLVFIDISMGAISGMQLAEHIRQIDESTIIVFATGFKGYLVQGYRVNAFRYLLKPVKDVDCCETLDKAQTRIDNTKRNCLIFQISGQNMAVPLDEILYIESEAHYIIIHSKRGEFRFRERLRDIALPNPTFCQCHRTAIVNMSHVYIINRDKVQLDDDTILPVSQTYWAALNQAFFAFHGKR